MDNKEIVILEKKTNLNDLKDYIKNGSNPKDTIKNMKFLE